MTRVIYLGGLGRSGTTLLERLLGELPGVAPAGELVHLWQRGIAENERCGCGQSFARCEFWTAVGEKAFGGWAGVDTGRVARLRAEVDRTRDIPRHALSRGRARPRTGPGTGPVADYASYYTQVYAAMTSVSGATAIVDSSKHASLAYCLRGQADLDLRVVHVVRDSRAVAYSWTKSVSRPDSATATFMTTYSPAAAAGHWNLQNAALGLLGRGGPPVLRVRYEDLVCDPAASLSRVAAFAGLTADLGFLSRTGDGVTAELRPAHTASGNPMRFVTGPVPIRPDQRWRTALPRSQRRLVTTLTWPLLARYGYLRPASEGSVP